MKPDVPTLEALKGLLDQAAMEIVMLQPGAPSEPLAALFKQLAKEAAGVEGGADFVKAAEEAAALAAKGSTQEAGALFEKLKALLSGEAPKAPPPPAAPAEEGAEPILEMNIESDGDILKEFITESREHLEKIEQGVLVLEENPEDADTLNTIFRAFHTFKGSAGFLNLIPINRLAHVLESLLDRARERKLTVDSDIIDIILRGADTLKLFLAAMDEQLSGRKPSAPVLIPTLDQIAEVRAILEGQAAPPRKTAAAKAAPAKDVSAGAPSAPASGAPAHAAAVVRIDTQKLDSLVDYVGELVIAESLVEQDAEIRALNSQNVGRNMAQLSRITKELQRIAMSMRMVPIRNTFQKMARVVRDVAAKQGKQVQFLTKGEETELDRTLVEEISDPLLHMIRNSVDHGIEMPEKRQAAGKPPLGTVELKAFHQGGNMVIQVRDDGGGLNKKRILAKALEKGLVAADANLDEKEIFKLIFAPGFSTADVVTDVSGRGVGMDVVLRNIEKLRGKIEIESEEGRGSLFTIYLPLTLAIIDGLVVTVGPERYILPTLSVRESFRPSPDMLSSVHERGEMVKVRGRLIPLLRLHQYFGIPAKSEDPTQGIVIVVESGHEARCVLVDDLIGKQEVVIKNLGEAFQGNKALAGGAILGDGRVGLILDTSTLVRLQRG